MLQNWFIMLPEICCLSFLIIAWFIEKFCGEKTAKTIFSLTQFFLAFFIIFTVVFYNKSAFPKFWYNTSFTTLFKVLSYLFAWAWFYLSSKWFLNKNRPSLKFYSTCFAFLLGFDVMASASSLLTLSLVIPFLCFLYYKLILCHWDVERVEKNAKNYAWCAVFCCLLLWVSTAIFYNHTGHFDYAGIKQAVSAQVLPLELLVAGLMLVFCLMFMMALVPLHTWFISFISTGILPVCGFITLVPSLIYLCCLINLMRDCLPAFLSFLTPVFGIFVGASLVVGALSSNYETNIRRLFGYLNIYCLGVSLLGVQGFSSNDVISSFAYLIIAVLSFAGIYTVFLGIKSRSEYLSTISSISGFCQVRPYMSAALLIFMFSLIGLAPTLGFFGYMSIINNLIASSQWYWVALLLGSLLFVAGACLQLIRIIYFTPVTNKYDRADKAIYICLFLNAVLILISLVNPTWLLHDALIILGGMS